MQSIPHPSGAAIEVPVDENGYFVYCVARPLSCCVHHRCRPIPVCADARQYAGAGAVHSDGQLSQPHFLTVCIGGGCPNGEVGQPFRVLRIGWLEFDKPISRPQF